MAKDTCQQLHILHHDHSRVTQSSCDLDATTKKLYEDATAATVQIRGAQKESSGFFVGDGSEVVTNAHCLEGNYHLFDVVTNTGKIFKARIEK